MARIVSMIMIVVIAIIAFVVFLTFSTNVKTSTGTIVGEAQFSVRNGDDLVTTAKRLEEQGIIAKKNYLMYYFWKEKLRGTLIAGTYTFGPASTVPEIARMITQGDATFKTIKVTFPEGWTIADYAARLDENGLPGEAFSALAHAPTTALRETYPFLPEDQSLEGYLFPDTYIFDPAADVDIVLAKMLNNFDVKVDEELRAEIVNQGKDVHEVVTLASVVENEVRSQKDRSIVAGIFWNRLDIGMPLQSDATVQYVRGEDKIKHTLEDLEVDSPYNTYKYTGLPPGPISSPGLKSIQATVFPEETEYFFFLNNPETGDTFFAKTLDQHVVNKNNNGL